MHRLGLESILPVLNVVKYALELELDCFYIGINQGSPSATPDYNGNVPTTPKQPFVRVCDDTLTVTIEWGEPPDTETSITEYRLEWC